MKKTNFDMSDTQKAFDKNVSEKLITKKRSPKKKETRVMGKAMLGYTPTTFR